MKNLLDRCREPTLKEILSDEIVEAVMEADRVDPHELEAMLAEVTRKLEQGVRFHGSDELTDAPGGTLA